LQLQFYIQLKFAVSPRVDTGYKMQDAGFREGWVEFLIPNSSFRIRTVHACSVNGEGLLFGFAAPRGGWECA